MVDTCTAVLPGDMNDATFNPVTGEYVSTGTTLYAGKCRVAYQAWAATPTAGETVVVVARAIVSLPVSAAVLPVDTDITINTSRDPRMAGAVYRVREVMRQTDATARRYVCEEQQS
jgi:hypothetical protein